MNYSNDITRGKEELYFKVETRVNHMFSYSTANFLKPYPFQDHQDQHAQQLPSQVWNAPHLAESTY